MKMNWDLFYACKLPFEFYNKIGKQGVHNLHIDTALKRIVKELNIIY